MGLAAGIKLVPAVTGLYYLLQRRFAVVVWSVVVFAATIALSLIVLPSQTWRYFSELIFDPGRTGPGVVGDQPVVARRPGPAGRA